MGSSYGPRVLHRLSSHSISECAGLQFISDHPFFVLDFCQRSAIIGPTPKPHGCDMKRTALLFLAPAIILSTLLPAVAQRDNFDDGDDMGWIKYDPLGTVGLGPQATYSFPNGGYRIQASRNTLIPAAAGPARAGSYRPDVYSDFYME